MIYGLIVLNYFKLNLEFLLLSLDILFFLLDFVTMFGYFDD